MLAKMADDGTNGTVVQITTLFGGGIIPPYPSSPPFDKTKTLYTGAELNKSPFRFYRLVNEFKRHKGHTYEPNKLNIDAKPFDKDKASSGLHCFGAWQMADFQDHVPPTERIYSIAEVTFPPDVEVVQERGAKFRTSQLILGEFKPFYPSDWIPLETIRLPLLRKDLFTVALCLAVVKANPKSIRDVPEWIMDPLFLLRAVQKQPKVLAELPSRQRSEPLCYEAVKRDWRMYEHVPDESRTELVKCALVKKRGRSIGQFDDSTKAMCRIALGKSRRFMAYVPRHLKSDMETHCKYLDDGVITM